MRALLPDAVPGPPIRAHRRVLARRPLLSLFSFVLRRHRFPEALPPHHLSDSRNSRVVRLLERGNYIGLIVTDSVLAELEFTLDLTGYDFKANDLAKHVVAIFCIQTFPSLAIRWLEGANEFVEHIVQLVL